MKLLNHTLSGTSFARFDYGYDSVNRRTYEKRNSADGDVYGYDAVDQVASVNYDATNPASSSAGADRTVGYAYDAVGNRTAVNDSVNGNASYTANNLNQYTSVGGISYGSDGNGNLMTGNGLYFYDAQNRLNYAQVGGNTDQYAYDSKNRVVERTVNGVSTYFIYDGWNLIEERDGGNNLLATYVHGASQDEMLSKTSGSTTVYYHQNGLGSVVNLTSSSGAVVEQYKYDAFGKPTITDGSGNPLTASAYGNRFLFTGREYLAEVNLYDYRNRVYSADLGRFLQTDPLRFSAGDVNIYRYCGNNLLNKTDATGLDYTVGNATQMVGNAALGIAAGIAVAATGEGILASGVVAYDVDAYLYILENAPGGSGPLDMSSPAGQDFPGGPNGPNSQAPPGPAQNQNGPSQNPNPEPPGDFPFPPPAVMPPATGSTDLPCGGDDYAGQGVV